jgi:glucosamine--fructose-6-phosphate aminotransferase (isomerizing)
MCGIFGYLGHRAATPILLEGLRRLEYRGYDSSGVAVTNGSLTVVKTVGRVDNLAAIVPDGLVGNVGISHTRWATHGGVTDENAHPHLSPDGNVAIVHNGIIENARLLRTTLESEGSKFISETDSEVLAHLIQRARESGLSPLESVRDALLKSRGTWGICVLFENEDIIICARHGSPLVIGIGEGETFIASDSHALTPHTQRVIYLEDGDLAELSAGEVATHRLEGGASDAHVTVIEEVWGEAELGDYPHFMLKEIHEQPESLRQCISGRLVLRDGNGRLGGLDLSSKSLLAIPHIRLIGCGTSLHACEVGAHAIERLARVPAFASVASEFRHRQPVINPKALYFAVSQSGETADTLAAVKEIQLKGGTVMGVINVVGSSIARLCGRGVYIHSGPEQAVASTKAFSNMVAALSIFALQIGRARSATLAEGRAFSKALANIPDQIQSWLDAKHSMTEAVQLVSSAKNVLFLGRGPSAAAAREGALKLMEIAYIPCLAYPAAEMKHGPIALLEEGSPVVVIAPDDELKAKTVSNIQECKARGARIILIHTEGDDEIAAEADISFAVPATNSLLTPLLTVLPLQMLAYETALALGCDIDRPRNLAKSVTVE